MADEGNEGQNRRMDLNLYLGLPHSARRRELDLGSDLSLGSLSASGEAEIRGSTEMSHYAEASDSHAPYSPSHASFSPNPQAVEPLDSHENSSFACPDYSSLPSYPSIPQATQSDVEPLVGEGRSHPEYSPYSPSYDSVIPTVEARPEPVGQDMNELTEHSPYSPSYAPASATGNDGSETMVHEGGNHVEYVPYSPSYVPASLSTPGSSGEPLVQEDIPHIPYIPVSPSDQAQHGVSSGLVPEATGFGAHQVTGRGGDTLVRDSPLHRVLLQYPEYRIRRLVESHRRRWPVRRFRSTVPYGLSRNLGAISSENGALRSVTTEESNEENSETQKTNLEGIAAQDSEEGAKEQASGTTNFDCNICLDVAKEPVVTSCGHLFCWPCLYQWLYLHCDHRECPVCKGEVLESKIIPIYGRGNSETGDKQKGQDAGNSDLKIPPRPRGHRFESLRQQIRRPFSQRLEEINSLRLILGGEILNGNLDRQEEPSTQRFVDGASASNRSRRLLSRLVTAQRFHMGDNLESGLDTRRGESSRNAVEVALSYTENGNSPSEGLHGGESRSTPPAIARHGIGFWPRHAFYSVSTSDRLAAMAADLSRMMRRFGNSGNQSGASSSMNPQDSNPNVQGSREATVAADQVSASSTMAVIQDDAGVPVDAPSEPNSGSSSRTLRRRRRNSVSGSVDVDGGVHHARKRRRLN
ncbi:PREDICTED: uncharacterized protein LOC104612851 [Nelumbo nucifera]|uniref:E3 ubiquitin-protein ligase RMA n=1 Tax=Nelumbo nucifera TaxID=4432 RepID=A0A1U8BNR5_NELNU|nr:PREDICTED: uncharacterized protein LOC104612851 [Nelumbo nucifera]